MEETNSAEYRPLYWGKDVHFLEWCQALFSAYVQLGCQDIFSNTLSFSDSNFNPYTLCMI